MQKTSTLWTKPSGFSLVELSIVLVILGLLVGGILSGQALIRASELRATTSQAERYTASVYTFRDKYFQLPGDMSNATQFWGVLAGDGANSTCQNAIATSSPTCNGNADGMIDSYNVNYSERYRAWQHLANAGLIEGSFRGRTTGADGTPYCDGSGSDCPVAKVGKRSTFTFAIRGFPGEASSTDVFALPSLTNTLFLGNSFSAPLKPEEAWNIDTKLDDGRPATGRVSSLKRTASFCSLCTTTDVAATSSYDVANSNSLCCLYFNAQ